MFEVQDERFIGSQPDAARSRRTVGVVADHYPLGHALADDVLGQLKLTGGAIKIVKHQQTLVVALAQVRPDLRVVDQQRVADTFFRLGLIPRSVKVAEIVWRPDGTQLARR